VQAAIPLPFTLPFQEQLIDNGLSWVVIKLKKARVPAREVFDGNLTHL